MGKDRKPIDRDLLYKHYVEDGMGSREIAKLIGVSGRTVIKYLRRHDIPVRDSFAHNIDHNWVVREYVEKNRSISDIAAEIGCSITTISYHLKQLDVMIRSASVERLGDSLVHLEDCTWLFEQYISLRKSSLIIAQEIGCSETTVRRFLKNHNIPIRNHSEAFLWESVDVLNSEEWMREQYMIDRRTIYDIATELGCGKQTVANYLKKHGIDIRGNSEIRLGGSLGILDNEEWMDNQYTIDKRTTHDIAAELGCDKATVSTYLKKHGIDIRTNSYRSSYERKITTFLEGHGIEFTVSDRGIISPLEVDIFIPSHQIAIEINGLYWHSEVYKDNNYHENKRLLCEAKGVRLIHLYEDDLLYRFPLIQRFLLNALNKTTDARVFARKCTINTSPPVHKCKELLNAHHIQGYAANNKALSLEYEGETVAVMLFKGNVLTRYATSCKVVGGFGKLLKASNVDNIVTFVDLDTFTGDAYFKVGFVVDKYLKPDYKYVVGDKRVHKFNYRLKKFRDDPGLLYVDGVTERELAALNKLYRIYDSGKYRLILSK